MATSDPVNVSVPNMTNAVQLFEDTHNNLSTSMRGLQSEFDALAASWGGDAAVAFGRAMHEFYDESNTIITSLHTLATDVDNAAINYAQKHGQATDTAQSLANQIAATASGLPGF